MLGSFLAHGLTREEAEGETLVQIIAGSDTTATAMRMTMLFLMTNPACYGSLVHEVRQAAAENRISSPITDVQAKTLPYLQAVIKEGLRAWPPVTGLMSVTVPRGGDVIHGMRIPEGTEIGWAAFGVLQDKGVFGRDADLFRPERWLEEKDPERLRAMNAQWEFVFKYGRWQCLGKTIALIELNKIFVEVSRFGFDPRSSKRREKDDKTDRLTDDSPQLLRRFDFSLANPSMPFSSYSAGIFIQSDLWVKATKAT
jgi:cytochrome P450